MVRSVIFEGSLVALGQVLDRFVGLGLFHQFENLKVSNDHVISDFVPNLVRLLQVFEGIVFAVFDAFLQAS